MQHPESQLPFLKGTELGSMAVATGLLVFLQCKRSRQRSRQRTPIDGARLGLSIGGTESLLYPCSVLKRQGAQEGLRKGEGAERRG